MNGLRVRVLLLAVLVLAVSATAQAATAKKTEGGTPMEDRYQRGWAILSGLDRNAAQAVQDGLADIAPDLGRFVVEFGYGDVYARPGLDLKTRQAATIAALTALGNAAPQLGFHMGAGLNAGLTPDEIVDVVLVTTVFAGFPAGLNALGTAREVFAAKGVSVTKRPAYDPGQPDRRARGLAALEATSRGAGQAVVDTLADVSPDMAGFILDFSYGDVISRTILEPRLKEVAMIAAAAARGTMRPQLKVHVRAGLNTGLSRREIVEVLIQMAVYAGFPASLNALGAAREAFAEAGS